MPEANESELAEHLRQRVPEALAELYDRYGQIAYALFLRITRDRATSEDLVQDLFLKVWTRARHFDPERGSLGVWILAIARNIAIDHLRSADVRAWTRTRQIEETQDSPSLQVAGPESTIHDVTTIRALLPYLSLRQKQVLEMAYFEGLSQSEIAAKLHEPLGSVKSWVRSGLSRLREALQKAGVK
jgi:RNA polymerase sigma-70 factor, ECF subfamily